MPAGLYWVARQSPVSPREVRGMFLFLGLLGIYVAATGIAEWQHQRWLVWPQYIIAESDPAFLGRAGAASEPDGKRDPDDRLPGEHAGVVAAGDRP